MSSQNLPLNLLHQEDHNNNFAQATCFINQEQEVEPEEEFGFYNQTDLANAPEFRYHEYDQSFERHVTTTARGIIRGTTSNPANYRSNYPELPPQNVEPGYSFQLPSEDLSNGQNYQYFESQISSSPTSRSQLINQSFDQPLPSNALAPSHIREAALEEYFVLTPGPLIMNLVPPPTEEELFFLQSWVPRGSAEMDSFFNMRHELPRCDPTLSIHDQRHIVIRIMLAEQGHTDNLDNGGVNEQFDQLGEILLGQHRMLESQHAVERQPIAEQPIPVGASTPPPPPPPPPPPSPPQSAAVTDADLVAQWGGKKTITNRDGVVQERLGKKRKSASVENRAHAEVTRLRRYPRSTGEGLSDTDVLQMVRLSPLERHRRASKIYTERGEYYGSYRRFTRISDQILRGLGLLRSWIPRCLSDRPSNSVERERIAIRLGLTGDSKLTADAAAERLRRAALGGSNGRLRRVTRSARPGRVAGTLGVGTPSSSTAAVLGAEARAVGTMGLANPASSSTAVSGAEYSEGGSGGRLGWEAGSGVDQQQPRHGSHRDTRSPAFLRPRLPTVPQEEDEEEEYDDEDEEDEDWEMEDQ
ncbi:hypothetical protein NHQ30_010379 [Ciborinia camelliae]|nr:hypothetical protein NHQ30_010379 [Ciborinia camelliae]